MDKQKSKYRWLVFFTVMLTYLLMASQRTAPGLITDQVMRDFQVTASTIGILTGIQYLVYTSLQVPMGILADRFGPNYFLIAGASLTGIGTIIYSIGTHEAVLFIARMLIGIGDATIWVNLVLILGQWFSGKEFVRLIGLAGMTGSLGFLLATVPFYLWIDLIGWRGAFFSAGIILCVCGILLYLVLVRQPQQIFSTEPQKNHTQVILEKVWTLFYRIISTPQAWALFCCHFGVVGAYVGFISSWAVPYGMTIYDMTRSDASQLVMIGLVGALIGAPFMSWISSKIGRIKQPYLIVQGMIFISWGCFLMFKGQPPFYLLLALFFIIGYGFGASALTFAAVRQTFPSSEAGIVSGFANTGGFLSAVLLPIIFGAILEYFLTTTGNATTGYYVSFIAPTIFSIVGIIGVLLLKENTTDNVMKKADR